MPRGRSKDSGRSNRVRCGLEHELALTQAALGSDIHFTAQVTTSNLVQIFPITVRDGRPMLSATNFDLLGMLNYCITNGLIKQDHYVTGFEPFLLLHTQPQLFRWFPL